MSACWLVAHHHLRITAQALMCSAWLVGSTAVLAQPVAPDQGNGTTGLIQLQGLQKQRLIQGQAATELSQHQAKEVAPTPPPGSPPRLTTEAAPASAPKLVTEADVLLQREQRLQRLNNGKVDPAVKP